MTSYYEPMTISDELCAFLGLEKGSKISKYELTKYIISYANMHNLKKVDNGRIFIFNDSPESKKFESILNKNASEEFPLSYFSLHACLKHHFIDEESSPMNTSVETRLNAKRKRVDSQ